MIDDAPETPRLKVKLASPRGFCAGVERAIRTVEETLERYGAPVFVKHEIVHNKFVVERLKNMGAVFVEDLDAVDASRPVIFSAHGVSLDIVNEANKRGLETIDATCPLVSKVHSQTRRFVAQGRHVILIGHDGHPEVAGTMGQAQAGSITLIEKADDVNDLPDELPNVAYVTQTTLSLDDTKTVIDALQVKYPHIQSPSKEDICYATSNRQKAVKMIAPDTDLFIVIGSKASSNSVRLVETALAAGARDAVRIESADDLDASRLSKARVIGISSGASAPEYLVEQLLLKLSETHNLSIETVVAATEDVKFNTPMRLAG